MNKNFKNGHVNIWGLIKLQISRHQWCDMFNTNEFTVAGVEREKKNGRS